MTLNFLAIFSLSDLRLKYKDLIVASLFLCLPFVNIFTHNFDLNDFIKSLLLYTNTILIVIILKNKIFSSSDYKKLFGLLINLGVLAAIFLIVQVIYTNVANSTLLYHPFKSFSYTGTGRDFFYDTSNFLRLKRGHGIFLEPSVAGWFSCVIFWTILYLKGINIKYRKIKLLILLSGIIFSLSASAYINIIVVISFHMFHKIKKLYKKILAIPVFILISLFVFNWIGVIEKIKQISIVGTSTYYRLAAPFNLLSDVLVDHLFGMPFGNRENILSTKSYMIHGQGIGTSIDNSYYLLIYFFGIIGILLCSLFILYSIYAVILNKEGSVFLILIVLILAGTGSTYTPEIGAVFLLYFCQLRYNKYHNYESSQIVRPCKQSDVIG